MFKEKYEKLQIYREKTNIDSLEKIDIFNIKQRLITLCHTHLFSQTVHATEIKIKDNSRKQ